jgi:cystathionine beta-lyase
MGTPNPFSIAAFEAAYRGGEAWLDELLAYLQGNRDLVSDYLAKHLPRIRLIQPEGTYLLWLDCRELGMSDAQLKDFFVHEARVGMNPGTVFGEGGSGFMRLNIGSPRHIIADALERIAHALNP